MLISKSVNSESSLKTASLDELSTTESTPHRRMPHRIEVNLLDKFQQIINKIEI